MFRDVSPQMSGLVTFWCTTLLYGVYIVIFFSCLLIMIKERSTGKPMPIILFISTIFQFMLSTTYMAMGLRMLIESFIWLGDKPEAVLAYWLSPSDRLQVGSKAIYIMNTLVGDAILVWRLYVVWGNNWYICVPPAIMVVATAVSGYVTIGELANLSALQLLFKAGNTILAAWALSIATQFSVSAAIAGRIMWISRSIPRTATHRYLSVVWIIVESGALYCITTILLLAFFDLKTQAGSIVGGILAQVAAIVPTLIIVRVGLHRSYEPTVVSSYPSQRRGRTASATNTDGSKTTDVVELGLIHEKGGGTLGSTSKSARVHIDVESWETRTAND